jgi:ribokinase
VQAVNTTGCGDTFCGVLAAGLAAGMTTDAAIMRAQRAAAITASRPGAYAALPTVRELAG